MEVIIDAITNSVLSNSHNRNTLHTVFKSHTHTQNNVYEYTILRHSSFMLVYSTIRFEWIGHVYNKISTIRFEWIGHVYKKISTICFEWIGHVYKKDINNSLWMNRSCLQKRYQQFALNE